MNEKEKDSLDQRLTNAMCGVETELRKANSFWRKLGLGVMTGFGTVIGATIVVAIALSILSLLAHYGIFTDLSQWAADTIGK